MLEERLDGQPKERGRRIMKDIERLSVLTEEVLSYLQAKASLGAPKNERVYLCPFLSSLVRGEVPEADVHVFGDKEAWLWTDKGYLRRAVANLLRNAVAYAGKAGPVVVSADEAQGDIRLSVHDRGPGVAPEDLPFLTHPGGLSSNTAWKPAADACATATWSCPVLRSRCYSRRTGGVIG